MPEVQILCYQRDIFLVENPHLKIKKWIETLNKFKIYFFREIIKCIRSIEIRNKQQQKISSALPHKTGQLQQSAVSRACTFLNIVLLEVDSSHFKSPKAALRAEFSIKLMICSFISGS